MTDRRLVSLRCEQTGPLSRRGYTITLTTEDPSILFSFAARAIAEWMLRDHGTEMADLEWYCVPGPRLEDLP